MLFDVLLWILSIAGIWWGTDLQVQYARANYPGGWRSRLFAAGAFVSFVGCWAVSRIDGYPTDLNLLISIFLFSVLFAGPLSAWGGPVHMRYVMPRRRED
jgi:hypothetical protein